MGYVKAILSFLVGLMNFSKWFTDRKDERGEKANSTKSVAHHDKNAADIDRRFPD